jgi:hypothetical protein
LGQQHISEEIQNLTLTFLKVLIESSSSQLKVSGKFVDIYNEACRRQGGSNNKEESNLQVRQHIRDNLLSSGYIIVDPNDVDSIYLTQKAIDQYAEY